MIQLPSKTRGMKKGFTLIELMVAIALIAVFIAILLPNIQQVKDAAQTESHKSGPYWVYREYEYAGGPVTSEISGSYQHSLQEILDTYVINLKKDQLKYSQELQSDAQRETSSDESIPPSANTAPARPVNPTSGINIPRTATSKEERIREIKLNIKNFKFNLSQNHASLNARRNFSSTISELQEELRTLGAQP